jgi:hypothetical protein
MSHETSLARREDKLKAQTVVSKEDVKEFCDAFYSEHADFTFRPFISGDVGQTLARTPPWYGEYQSRLAENFANPETEYSSAEDKEEAAKPGEDADEQSINKVLTELKSQIDDAEEKKA